MDFLELYPVPLSPMDRQAGTTAMAELLQDHPFDEIVQDRVDTIFAWKDEDSPVLRRIHRNLSRAYSRTELERATDLDLRRFLPQGEDHA